jgi:hypothetical protein
LHEAPPLPQVAKAWCWNPRQVPVASSQQPEQFDG